MRLLRVPGRLPAPTDHPRGVASAHAHPSESRNFFKSPHLPAHFAPISQTLVLAHPAVPRLAPSFRPQSPLSAPLALATAPAHRSPQNRFAPLQLLQLASSHGRYDSRVPDANDATDGPGPVAAESQEAVATTAPASTPTARVGSKKPAPKKAAKATKKPGPPKLAPVSERMLMLQWFPELFLGVRSYPWQFKVLEALNYRHSRVALKASNGSGKTSSVVAAAILWHMMRFEGGVTVITAGVYRQIVDVLWPVLKARTANLGGAEMGWKVTEGRIEYTAPDWRMPSQCIGFTAEAPEKAEGWHARGAPGKEDHLLYIIDEAKGVSDQIFHAMERCQPTRVLVVSSPGGSAGAFYDIFRKPDTRYDLFTVTAHDCPHIKQEWIDEQIATYGEKSALIRSMIFAEFGEEDGNALVLPPTVLQKALSSPASKVKGVVRLGCDFAAGGDENVIAVAEGNFVREVIRWREKDTMAAVGRFITEFRRLGVEAHNVYADGSGIGIPMCDALREAGWDVVRVNNGGAAVATEKFANRGTEMWVQFARLVETGKVIIPADDELLHRQLTTRRLEHNSKGKLMVEPKDKMKTRGLSSPDRADAMVLAYCGGSQSLDPYFARNGKQSPLAYLDEQEPIGAGAIFSGAHAG